MVKQLDKADIWLKNEIIAGLITRFGVKKSEAEKLIKNSNFMRLLMSMPEQVHHESPDSWVNTIARQNKLKELVY